MNTIKFFLKGTLHGMKTFGFVISDIVNFILLVPVYFIGVGFSSLLGKLSGKKFLNLKNKDKNLKSYWVEKDSKKKKIDYYYRQF
jgi:hypothetical protein